MTDDATSRAGEQVRKLTEDVGALIRDEVRQGQDEMLAKARQAAKGFALLGAAGVLGAAAAGTSTVLLVRLLDRLLPPTAAAAVASAGLAGGAAALAAAGVAAVQPVRPLLPERTIREMRSDVQAAARSAG